MIEYDNANQFGIIFKLAGSVLPGCLPVGVFTFLIGLALSVRRWVAPSDDFIEHEFAVQVMAVVIGYLLVVRTNMALERWMDGISEVQVMLSKWADAHNALSSYFSGRPGSQEELERILMFRVRVAHWFGLMSCLAFATLRGGGRLVLDDVPIKELFDDEQGCQKAKSFTRTRRYASSRSSDSSRKDPDMEGLDLYVLSAPTAHEVALLEMASDKVNTVCLWIVQGIVMEVRTGTLDSPPPIVTRTFQELSSGMLGFNQAHKVAMVPFPFPFAQMVSLLLSMLYVVLPVYIDAFTQNPVITPIISCILPICYCGLNRIAIELEEPFGMDANDVDIDERHEEFLWLLVDVLRQPMIPPVTPRHALEKKILRGLAQFSEGLQEEIRLCGDALQDDLSP